MFSVLSGWEGYDRVEDRGTSTKVIPSTHDNIALDIILNRREGSRTQQICVGDMIPMWHRSKQSQSHADAETSQPRRTKQPQETLGCFEERYGVDASVGDGDICKRLAGK